MPQEKINQVKLTNKLSQIESHILLQKILRKEAKEQLNEEAILKFDDEIQKEIEALMVQFQDYREYERQRKEMLVQIQSSFLQRVTETPFGVELKAQTRLQGLDSEIIENKAAIKKLLTLLHVHPCYLINLYKCDVIPRREFYQIVKEIYSFQNERVNYLLMGLCQGIIECEFSKKTKVEEINLSGEDSVVGSIFKYIFKSQEINIDTLCCICCHLIKQVTRVIKYSKLITKHSQSGSGNAVDGTYDVTDRLSKSRKQFEGDKQNKNLILINKSKDLYHFIEEIIREINDDDILPSNSSYFGQKNRNDEYKRKIIAENTVKIDSLRFSPEISFLSELILTKFKDKDHTQIDDIINSKILSLIFTMLDKIWKDYEIYLYPYIKEIKRISILEDVIKKSHFNNLNNLFHVMGCFFTSQTVFEEYTNESWNKDLVSKLNHLQQSNRGMILGRILDKNQIKSLNFKNFENIILHSLESEGHTITISKRTIARLYNVLHDNQGNVCPIKPISEDPLPQILEEFKDSIKNLSKAHRGDKVNFKLKTRLLIDEDHAAASRCGECNSILNQKYAPPDNSGILEKYNPEDSQSLSVLYCKILRLEEMGDIFKTDDIIEFIEKKYTTAKRNKNFVLANQLNKFQTQFNINVQMDLNKNQNEKEAQYSDINEEDKIKEKIYEEILKQAESKINERRTRKFDLNIIKRRIHKVLKPKIDNKIKMILEKEIPLYKATLYNVQYGLANHELKNLADGYTSLSQMRKIIDFISSTKMSKNLFRNIRDEQKQVLRAIVKKKAGELLRNGTIINIKVADLHSLMKKCEFVFFENEDLGINAKLVFREQQWALCGPPVIKSENQLYEFSISQKELLRMRKVGKTMDDQSYYIIYITNSVTFNVFEFDRQKLLKIFNEMERSKSAYLLNSAQSRKNIARPHSQHPTTGDTRL